MRRIFFIALFLLTGFLAGFGADEARRDMVLRAQALLNLGARGDVVGDDMAASVSGSEKVGGIAGYWHGPTARRPASA